MNKYHRNRLRHPRSRTLSLTQRTADALLSCHASPAARSVAAPRYFHALGAFWPQCRELPSTHHDIKANSLRRIPFCASAEARNAVFVPPSGYSTVGRTSAHPAANNAPLRNIIIIIELGHQAPTRSPLQIPLRLPWPYL